MLRSVLLGGMAVVLAGPVYAQTGTKLVINEILYDPSNLGLDGDANGDGVFGVNHDEFVELVYTGAAPLDITGWTLRFNDAPLFTFPATVLTAQTAVVVFGGGTPAGTFGGATVYTAGGWSGLANSGGIVSLVEADGIATNTLLDYTPELNDPNQSLTRVPDITGPDDLELHSTVAPCGQLFSPGTKASGEAFAGAGFANTAPCIAPVADQQIQIGRVLRVNVHALDTDGDPLSLSISNAPAAAVFEDFGDGTGLLTYTGQVADAETAFVIGIHADDGTDTSARFFSLFVVAAEFTGLVINEYLADPDAAGGIHVDANDDGVLNPNEDEFVEIVNNTTGAIDLAGFQLWDAQALRHVFSSRRVERGGVMVVFGGGSVLHFTNPPAQLASSGGLDLQQGTADAIVLLSPTGGLIDRVDYASAGQADADTRQPDITGGFTNHLAATTNAARASPGRMLGGTHFLTNQPPLLVEIGDQVVAVDNQLEFPVRAYDPADRDPIALSVLDAPTNAVFAATNNAGTFSFTPHAGQVLQVFNVRFVAADADGAETNTVKISVVLSGGSGDPWINEIHYDNVGSDVNEGVEIAGPAGTDLGAYALLHYNGANGLIAISNALSGAIDDEVCGVGAVWFPIAGLQNDTDGLALVRDGSNVVQFLSWEGTFTANDGAAAGMTSTDIGIQEPDNASPDDHSLQLAGTGSTFAAFFWEGPQLQSQGSLNVNQVVDACEQTVATAYEVFGVAPNLVHDAQITSGAYSVSITFADARLMATNAFLPAFDVVHAAGPTVLVDEVFTDNTFLSGGFQLRASNATVSPLSAAQTDTGLYRLGWSAINADGKTTLHATTLSNGALLAFTVIDDDDVAPTPPGNVLLQPEGWTNAFEVVITFDPGTDASGIHEHRLAVGPVPPSLPTDGEPFASGAALTNLAEGSNLVHLFAVDDDRDRDNDQLKSENVSALARIDRTAPDAPVVTAAVAAAGNPFAEIDLGWTPSTTPGDLPGQPLSPWSSYVIFLTDDGTDPDPTNFTQLVRNTTGPAYALLGARETSAVTITGLQAGATYKLALVGLDEAGNRSAISGIAETTLAAPPPPIDCPEDIRFWVPTKTNEAVVFFDVPSLSTACSMTVVCTPPSGSSFPLGTTTVECVASDLCGNGSTCTFEVVVFQTQGAALDPCRLPAVLDGAIDASYAHLTEAPFATPAKSTNHLHSDFIGEGSARFLYAVNEDGETLIDIEASEGHVADVEEVFITWDANHLYLAVKGPNAFFNGPASNEIDRADLFIAIDTLNSPESARLPVQPAGGLSGGDMFDKLVDFAGWSPNYFIGLERVDGSGSETFAQINTSDGQILGTDLDHTTDNGGIFEFFSDRDAAVTEFKVAWSALGGFPDPTFGATWNIAVYTTGDEDGFDAYDTAPGFGQGLTNGSPFAFEQLGDVPFDGDHCAVTNGGAGLVDPVSGVFDTSCGFAESDGTVNSGIPTGLRVPASDNSGRFNNNEVDTIQEYFQVLNVGALLTNCGPAIALEKTVYLGQDDGASCPALEFVESTNGALITYCFEVSNSGDEPLTDVTITDPDLQGFLPIELGTLETGETVIASFDSFITANVTNTATVTGMPLVGPAVADSDSAAVNVGFINPDIGLRKTVYAGHDEGASCPGFPVAQVTNGAPITYCFTVTNRGDVALSEVTLTDLDLPGFPATGLGTLSPGEATTIFFETHATNSFTNTAVVVGTPPFGPAVSASNTAVIIKFIPSTVILEKSVYLGHDGGASCPGAQFVQGTNGAPITYCFRVENIGEVQVDQVTISDPILGFVPIELGSMAPGEEATVFVEETVTQDVVNRATVTALNPDGEQMTHSDTAEVDLQVPLDCIFGVTDLGTLGGTSSQALDINNARQIVGRSANAQGVTRGFLWENGSMSDLGSLPSGARSEAWGINDSGQIVGESEATGEVFGVAVEFHAVLFEEGSVQDLGTLGGINSTGRKINDAGNTAGWANPEFQNNFPHPYLHTNDTMIDLGTFSGASSGESWDLNNATQVVGFAHWFCPFDCWHPFIWEDLNGNGVDDVGEMIDLHVLGGANGVAHGINDFGDVVGGADTAVPGERHAFLVVPDNGVWFRDLNNDKINDLMVDLGTLGGSFAEAWDINNAGVVVGYSFTAEGEKHAFIWENGNKTDLNDLIETDTGWTLREARAINEAGEIVGFGTISNETHAFLLTPCEGVVGGGGGLLEIQRMFGADHDPTEITMVWSPLETNFSFTLEYSTTTTGPVWTTVAPTNQWPSKSTFWTDQIEGEANSRVFRVRATRDPP